MRQSLCLVRHDNCRQGHAGRGHLPATVSDWAGRLWHYRWGWHWACSTPPVQVTVEPQGAVLALYPCPSERTSVGLRELEPSPCPCFEVPAGVLAHGSWGPMAFCPFLRRQLGSGCLPVGDPGDLFPRDPGQKVQSQPGSGGCFLLETQGSEGPNIPQSSPGPDPPHPPHPSTETFQSHVNMCTKPFFKKIEVSH